MASNDELSKGEVVIWKTEITYGVETSPVFKFQSCEWRVKYERPLLSESVWCYLRLESEHKPLNPFYVDCYAANQDEEKAGKLICHRRTKVTGDGHCIFASAPTYMEKEIKDIRSHGKVAFVLIFRRTDERICKNSETNIADKSVQTNLDLELENLSRGFSFLLENEDLPDVQLKCGDCVLPAHKSVLAARSSVFLAMFSNKMKEENSGVVDIPDVEIPVLKLFLKALYSGKFPDMSKDTFPKFYTVCDKYAALSLKEMCSDRMVNFLSEDNYQKYLLLADAHNDQDFKNSISSFICDNPEFLRLDSWLSFSDQHSKLAITVYRKCLTKSGFIPGAPSKEK